MAIFSVAAIEWRTRLVPSLHLKPVNTLVKVSCTPTSSSVSIQKLEARSTLLRFCKEIPHSYRRGQALYQKKIFLCQ